ncbi:MAG: DedA family protein [Dermatophilaceae bacterium]
MDVLWWLIDAVPVWVVVAVLATSLLLETGLLVGMVLPGTTAALALGVLSGSSLVPLAVCLAVGAAAAVAGTQLGFLGGRRSDAHQGRPALGRFGESRRHRAAELVRRRGLVAVPLAQMVVGARTLAPRVMAHGGVPWLRYGAVGVPAAALWAVALVATGHLAGASIEVVTARIAQAGWWALAAVAVAAVGALGVHGFRRCRQPGCHECLHKARLAQADR